MLLSLFAQTGLDADNIPWPLIAAVAAAIVLFGMLMFVAKRYKRCPSNRVLVIYGKTGGGNAAKCVHGGGRVRLPAHPGLRLPEPRADPDRGPAQGRPVDREHPRQRAERLHRRHRHRPGDDAERRHPPARPGHRRDQAAGRRHHLRPAAAGHRLDADRGHQPRPRQVPGEHPEVARAGAEEDRPGADQRQHHRHHGRERVHRGHRPQGRGDRHPAGQDRRGRAGEEGPDRRRRGRARAGHLRWPTRPSSARSAPARRPASRRSGSPSSTRRRQVGEQTALLEQEALDQGVAAAAGDPDRRARPRPEGRRAEGGVRARGAGRRGRPRQARPPGRRQRQGDRRRGDGPGRHRRRPGRRWR